MLTGPPVLGALGPNHGRKMTEGLGSQEGKVAKAKGMELRVSLPGFKF